VNLRDLTKMIGRSDLRDTTLSKLWERILNRSILGGETTCRIDAKET